MSFTLSMRRGGLLWQQRYCLIYFLRLECSAQGVEKICDRKKIFPPCKERTWPPYLQLWHPPWEWKIRDSNPTSARIFPGRVIPVTSELALWWLPCQAPGITGSALGLVGPVSVYCDWERWKVWSATSVSVWQHVNCLSRSVPDDGCVWHMYFSDDTSCVLHVRSSVFSDVDTCVCVFQWDPERIKPETLFIMGARANKWVHVTLLHLFALFR